MKLVALIPLHSLSKYNSVTRHTTTYQDLALGVSKAQRISCCALSGSTVLLQSWSIVKPTNSQPNQEGEPTFTPTRKIFAKPLYPASVLNKEGTPTLYFTSGYIWKEVKASPLHYVTMLSTVTSWQVAVRLSVQDQNWKRNLFQTVLSALPNSFRLHIDSLKTPKYTKIHIDTALVFAKLFSPLKEFAASYAGYAAIISFLLQASAGRTSCGSYPARSPTRWKLAEDLTWLDLDSI